MKNTCSYLFIVSNLLYSPNFCAIVAENKIYIYQKMWLYLIKYFWNITCPYWFFRTVPCPESLSCIFTGSEGLKEEIPGQIPIVCRSVATLVSWKIVHCRWIRKNNNQLWEYSINYDIFPTNCRLVSKLDGFCCEYLLHRKKSEVIQTMFNFI